MTTRTKLFSLAAVLALALAAGLWLLTRPHPVAGPAISPVAQSPAVPTAAAPVSAETSPPLEPTVASPVATVSVTPLPAPASATPVPVAAHATTKESPPPAIESGAPMLPAENAAELAATARMYAAHAPLRAREVADPDSEANKRILGTMVSKLLTAPPVPDSTGRHSN